MSLVAQLQQFLSQLDRYELPLILVLGTLFNLTNVFVFCRRKLRTNACSWYFVCLSFIHVVLLDVACLQRVVGALTSRDVVSYVVVICKLRAYMFDLTIGLSRHFLCLITIDRWMVTSSYAWLRKKSSTKVARWLIIGSIVFWSIFSLNFLIGFEINSHGCTPASGSTYEVFYSIYSIITSFLPMLIMILFSILTLRNVRAARTRQIHSSNVTATYHVNSRVTAVSVADSPRQRSKRDRQLIRLSLLQVHVFLLLNSVWAFFPLYVFLVNVQIVSFGQRYITLINAIGLNLLFTYAAVTFILYTLVSSTFRKEFLAICREYLNKAQQRLEALF